jgi:protein-arginine kinase activator protein McsA
VKNAKQWRKAKDLDFMQAAKLRDDIKKLQGQLT